MKEHVRVMVCSGGLGYRDNMYLSKLSKFTLKICAFLLTLRGKKDLCIPLSILQQNKNNKLDFS